MVKRIYVDCPSCGLANLIAENPTAPIETLKKATREVKCKNCKMTLDTANLRVAEE